MTEQTSAAPLWLTPQEQQTWRAYLRADRLLFEALDDALDEHGVRLSEYEFLSMLSEEPGGRLRMSALANKVVQSRSRLTHTAGRLEKRGWVHRVSCLDDRRGVEVVLTDDGRDALTSLAVTHVRSVRESFVDLLEPEEFEALGAAMAKVATALDSAGERGPGTDEPQQNPPVSG